MQVLQSRGREVNQDLPGLQRDAASRPRRQCGILDPREPFFLLTLPAFIGGFSKGAAVESTARTDQRHQNEARFNLAWTRVTAVKSLVKDPDSFTLEDVHVTNADIVCIEYTARNSHGDLDRESIIVDEAQPYQSSDDDGKFAHLWDSLCTTQESWNFTDRVKSSL